MSKDTNPTDEAYADASPLQPKRKRPLLQVASELGLSGRSLRPTVRAAVAAAV